jgi:hypothetical protein
MSDLKYYGRGRLLLPAGLKKKNGENFLRFGELVPDAALKAMGDKKVNKLVTKGELSTKDFWSGKHNPTDATQGRRVEVEAAGAGPRGRGRPPKATPETAETPEATE